MRATVAALEGDLETRRTAEGQRVAMLEAQVRAAEEELRALQVAANTERANSLQRAQTESERHAAEVLAKNLELRRVGLPSCSRR